MMRSVQITLEHEVLAALDATADVQEQGRSAVIRVAVKRYLRDLQDRATDDRYREAYAGGVLGKEVQGWEEEQAWPEES